MPRPSGRPTWPSKSCSDHGARVCPGSPPTRGQPALQESHGTRRRHAGHSGRLHGRPDRPRRRRQIEPAGPGGRRPGHPAGRHRGAGRRHGTRAPPAHGLPPYRLHAARPGQEPLPHAVGGGEPAVLRPPVRPRCRRAAPTHRRTDPQHRPVSLPGTPGGQAFRRHEAETRPVLRSDPRPGPAHPGRAHHRRRPAGAGPVLGTDRAHPRRTPRHERHRRHGLHGGGAAFRLAGSHGRRPGPGHRRASRTAGVHRDRHTGGRLHRAAAAGQAPQPPARGAAAAGRGRRRAGGHRGA